jgi:hypothetical protein
VAYSEATLEQPLASWRCHSLRFTLPVCLPVCLSACVHRPRSAAQVSAAASGAGGSSETDSRRQQQELAEAVREADARLATEQRYWQLGDPIRSLPVGVVRRSVGGLLQEIASQIEEVEVLYSYAELIEERRDAAMAWIERVSDIIHPAYSAADDNLPSPFRGGSNKTVCRLKDAHAFVSYVCCLCHFFCRRMRGHQA